MASANENRNSRNLLNNEVKLSKVLRDDLNKKATELNEIVQKIKRERMTETGGPSLNRMRNELKSLEFKAMTSVMTVDKEKELIGAIQRLQAQIEDQERKMEENTGSEISRIAGYAKRERMCLKLVGVAGWVPDQSMLERKKPVLVKDSAMRKQH